MQLPEDYMPDWLKTILTIGIGAGGAKLLSVYLENRRLQSKDFRETLLERIRELEKVVASLQTRMGNLRVEMAHLEVENKQLKRDLGLCEREASHADDASGRGDDDGKPA